MTMVIGIFGESCTGKSTLADYLKTKLQAKLFTGKDYLRLAKSENEAREAFRQLLAGATGEEHILYVMAEKHLLSLLPDHATRILVTAEMETIKSRFAGRMGGKLPAPVAAMLERNHGCFDAEPHHIHYRAGEMDPESVYNTLRTYLS